MASKDYYSILGVGRNATEKEIKSAYRKLSLQYHPDKQVGKPEAEQKAAEEKFKEIGEAYGVLSDSKKKANYDRYGSADGPMGGGGFSGGFDMGGFGGAFDEMFSFFNDQRRGGSRRPREEVIEPGGDIQMRIKLTIEDIYKGCTKKVKYSRNVRCANCHGKGGFKEKPCPHCHGTGTLVDMQATPFGRSLVQMPCPHCHATGYIVEEKCPTCGGTGFKADENTVTLNYMPGTPEGFALEMKGSGHESRSPKGPNGNLYAIPVYDFDRSKYEVRGLDVMEQIYLPYYDLLLGTDYTHTLPDGNTVKIKIPSCIPECDVLRINKKGINAGSRVGDYYLQVHYQFPMTLKDEERKLIEKIKENCKVKK